MFAAVEERPKDVSSKWGDIKGVRLTAVDEAQQYAHDSLATVLENQDRGRHVARVAHLYFARMPTLTQADLEIHLLTLIKKILGPSPMVGSDWGWLGTINFPDLPRSLRDELKRDLDSTFDEKKWGPEHLKAFRLFQLLDPYEPENLFRVVYTRPNTQFQYLFPTADLPPKTEKLLNSWRLGKQDLIIPQFLAELCSDPIRLPEGYLQLDLTDLFTLRFLNWYTGGTARQQGGSQVIAPSQGSSKTKNVVQFASIHVPDLLAGNPAFEILQAYFQVFIPNTVQQKQSGDRFPQLSNRARAIFRWSIGDLWFNRTKLCQSDPIVPSATVRQLQAIFVLITHIAAEEESLCKEMLNGDGWELSSSFKAFRAGLRNFFVFALTESGPDTDSSFENVLDLAFVYLTPWKAAIRSKERSRVAFQQGPKIASGTTGALGERWMWFIVSNFCAYFDVFLKALTRLDQDTNPNLEGLEAFARMFSDADSGPFSSPAICVLIACELIMSNNASSVDILEKLSFVRGVQEIFAFVFDRRDAIAKSITEQYQELGYKSFEQYRDDSLLSPSVAGQIRSFIRELLHKRKAHKFFGKDNDWKHICMLFGVKDELVHDVQGTKQFTAVSLVQETFGVPKWLEGISPGKFHALTEDGRRYLLSGLTSGTSDRHPQYLGDYSERPVEAFEIPVFVWLASRLARSLKQFVGIAVDLRPFADARNILWLLVAFQLFAYARLSTSFFPWIISFAIFAFGSGTFRGISNTIWNTLFGFLWVYAYWSNE